MNITLLNSLAKAGCGMFQQMFASMNEMLDKLVDDYKGASEQGKRHYEEQINELKKMSDSFIEQWLQFEEKIADFKQMYLEPDFTKQSIMNPDSSVSPCSPADLEISDDSASIISKGQGYYKLFMFSHAADQFQFVISQSPECNLARLFLGMTHMHLQNWNEAQRHFQLLIALTEFPKWLAMGYNALGCIQAVRMNLTEAEQLFKKAHHACPSFKDPLNNLKSCQETPQQLSLYFGSTELCCL